MVEYAVRYRASDISSAAAASALPMISRVMVSTLVISLLRRHDAGANARGDLRVLAAVGRKRVLGWLRHQLEVAELVLPARQHREGLVRTFLFHVGGDVPDRETDAR